MATAGKEEIKEFPDVTQKLAAPKKLSAFEKERQAAEEKRRRAEAETAAALKEFEDSFAQQDDHDIDHDHDDAYDGFPSSSYGTPTAPRASAAPGYRHPGSQPAFHSGAGSLDLSGPRVHPLSLKRKRALDEMREAQEARRLQDASADDYTRRGPRHEARYSPTQHHDNGDEREDVAPRPTVQLSSLPPSTTTEDVKRILRDHLPVYSVHFQSPAALSNAARKSCTVIATLSSETSTTQIDTAVSALKDKYLGNGFRLSMSRHLSSTSLLPTLSTGPVVASQEPFGAQKPIRDQPRGFNMRNAPPPSDFAPPDSYDMLGRPYMYANATIAVQSPLDINTIRAVHTVVDRLLSEPDADRALQIEAMLMVLPEVQRDERFSFLYDSRSTAGVYYRFLLWNHNHSYEAIQERKRLAKGPERVIDDVVIDWVPPHEEVPFADLTNLGGVVGHQNYESSDEESDDGDSERRLNSNRREDGPPPDMADRKCLTPLQVAKFAWLLSRIPSNHARLRKGDVATISSFAINHAGAGADEIVDILVLNVEKPYTSTQCAKYDHEDSMQDEDDIYEPDEELPTVESVPKSDGVHMTEKREAEDPSQAKLVALYLINDVLHNSSTAGVRNAWKYRQLFENAFKRQKTFEHLGRLERDLGWGRIKAEQWRNKIRVLFEIWEHGSVFASDVFERLKRNFFDQPAEVVETRIAEEANESEGNWMGRFKRIDGTDMPAQSASPAPTPDVRSLSSELAAETMAADGVPLHDLDGAAMDDIDGAPMDDLDGTATEDLDGVFMENSKKADEEVQESAVGLASSVLANGAIPGFSTSEDSTNTTVVQAHQRRRKQAEDMFADSDEE